MENQAGGSMSRTLQYLLPRSLRDKIYASTYWKKHCVDLTILTLPDKAEQLDYVGGANGDNLDPLPFLCLLLKMLLLQPKREKVIEIMGRTSKRYVYALAAFCLQLTGTGGDAMMDADVYRCLESLYSNKQNLMLRTQDGTFSLKPVDKFVKKLLEEDSSCNIQLPKIRKRHILEAIGLLEPRSSAVPDDFQEKEERAKDYQPTNGLNSSGNDEVSSTARSQSEPQLPSNAIGIKTKEGVALATKMLELSKPEPFVGSLLVAGHDEKGPSLYYIDRSGRFQTCTAKAIGSDSHVADRFLQEQFKEVLTLEETETIALSTLSQVMVKKVTPNRVAIAKVSSTNHLYSNSEVEAVIGGSNGNTVGIQWLRMSEHVSEIKLSYID